MYTAHGKKTQKNWVCGQAIITWPMSQCGHLRRHMHVTLPVPVCRVLSHGNVRATCIHFDADSQCNCDLHLYLVSLYMISHRYAMNVALPWWASGLNPEKHRHCNSHCTATNARTPFVPCHNKSIYSQVHANRTAEQLCNLSCQAEKMQQNAIALS